MRIVKPFANELRTGDTYKAGDIKKALRVQEFDCGVTVFFTEINGSDWHVESFTEFELVEWIER